MTRLGLLLNLLLALGAAGAPLASAAGPTLVICGADGVFSVPLDGGAPVEISCCDCCLAGSASPAPAPMALAGRSAPLRRRRAPATRRDAPRRALPAIRARAPPVWV